MPIQTLNTIKTWFKTGLKPSQQQFWDTWDSFRHKFEKVPLKDIENLEQTLNEKAEKSQLDLHTSNQQAHAELFSGKEDKNQKGIAGGYVPLDEFSKIASQYLSIANNLVTNSETSLLSAQQGVMLQNQIKEIENLLVSDNASLDTIQKIADYIEEMQLSLNNILVNDLATGGITKALTAEMGKLLQSSKEDKSQKGIAGGYAPLNSFTKLASQYLEIVNDLTTGGSTSLLSAEQGKILQSQINGINTLLKSNNINLDTIQEIIDAIEEVQISLSTILVNDLTTGGTTKALTAEMGKQLNEVKANLISPTFTGIPTAPTALQGTTTTQIATTEFVKNALDNSSGNGVVSVTGDGVDNNDPKNPVIQAVSGTQAGVINTTSLQELGGVDKSINGVQIGRGNGNVTTNTVVGYQALFYTTADQNTGIGYQSLQNNKIGNSNTAIGAYSLKSNISGSYNTAIGVNSLLNNTGSNNTGVGSKAMNKNTSGFKNVAVGDIALFGNTTGCNNTVVGQGSAANIISGNSNTAVGSESLYCNSSGSDNVAIGFLALNNARGNENVAIGNNALFGLTTPGNGNIGLGHFAGRNIGPGSNNIVIGNRIDLPISTGSNQLNIGNIIFGISTNTPTVGAGSIGIGKIAPTEKLDVDGNIKAVALNIPSSGLVTVPVNGLIERDLNGQLWETHNGQRNLLGAYPASETTTGTVKIATDAETQISSAVSEDNKVVSRAKLFNWWDWIKKQSQSISGSWTFTGSIKAKKATTGDELTTLDQLNSLAVDAAASVTGFVNNVELQELGGTDKTINGVRIGRGVGNVPSNTAVGGYSLQENTTGEYNTALGASSLSNNTEGQSNTALGSYSLFFNKSGIRNTAVGDRSLKNNSTGSYNTAVGYGSLNSNTEGSCNIAVGDFSLARNTEGILNTAIGFWSLVQNTTGSNNTAVGKESLNSNTEGSLNTAVGNESLNGNTEGRLNTAVGNFSLHDNITGEGNTAVGAFSGCGITTGNNNTIIGRPQCLNENDSNLVILSDGSGNVAIRKDADNRLLAPTLTQALIVSGGKTSLINKDYADNMGAALNTTTTALTSANLTSAYPNALVGFRVHCKNIAAAGLIYEKTSGGWLQYPVTIVP